MNPLLRSTLCLLIPLAEARAEPTTGVDLKLLSELASIKAGHAFTVGLHIHHHDGYHSYWKNPGIVGVPTQLDWSLPPGFTARPIVWPAPEIVDMAGHPAHGFHRDVLLLVEIIPPPAITPSEITLRAAVTWMACAKECHPGHTTLSLTLPVGEAASINPAHKALFNKARKELPQTHHDWAVQIESDPGASPIRLRLTPKSPSPMAEFYFFSADGQVSSDQVQTLRLNRDGSYLLSVPRAQFGPSQYTHLPGVLRSSKQFGPNRQLHAVINPSFSDCSPHSTP